MARMVLVMADGMPARVWHDEAQAEPDADEMHDALGRGKVELWDVPVGRSVGVAERLPYKPSGKGA